MMNNSDRLSGVRALAVTLLVGYAAAFASGCSDAPLGPLVVDELATPAGDFSGQAHLAVTPDGTVILSWLESTTGDGMALKFATLAAGGTTWSAARTLAEGENWFVNWADFPSVVPMNDSVWAAHWLVFQDNFHAYDSVVAISTDAGASWSEPFLLNTDGSPAEHGFVTLFGQGESIGAVWLDGRDMVVDGEFVYASPTGELLGTNLRYASFDFSGARQSDVALDALVCDCCQPDVALAAAGPIVIYRDRSLEEVRDIVVRRMVGGNWQPMQALPPDGWEIPGCPVNGPAIAAAGDEVAAAWFSAPGNQPFVRYARSHDGGASFSAALDIDTAGSFGYVDVELLGNGDAVVSWLRSAGDDLDFVTRRVSADGVVHPVERVAGIDSSQPLDFPQMVTAGERIIFMWTDYTTGSNVATAVGHFGR